MYTCMYRDGRRLPAMGFYFYYYYNIIFLSFSLSQLVKTCADVVYVFYNDRYCTSGEGKTVEPYMTEVSASNNTLYGYQILLTSI